jgi:sugar phosphate permease
MVDAVGWRTTFILFACLNLLIVLLFLAIVRDHPDHSTSQSVSTDSVKQNPLAGIRELIGHRDFWIISFGSFSRYGVFAAVQALWAGPYLMTAIGISPVATGNLLFLTSIGLIIGSPVFGYLSDALLVSRKIPIYLGLLGKILILVTLARLRPGASLVLLSILFFGLGFLTSSGQIMYAHIKERMTINRAGAAMTGINFFTMVGVAFFLQVLGNTMQYLFPDSSFGSSAFEYAFYFCSAALLLAGILYTFTRETLPFKPLL